MSKNSPKTRRDQQKTYIVELGQSRKIAGKPGARNGPDRAKQTKKRRAHKLPVCLTIPEKNRFFQAIKGPRDRAIFSLMYFHGLRASEPGRLKLSDYRQGSSLNMDRILLTRLKGSLSGECGVVPAAAQAVRAWIRKRGHEEGVLFPSRQRGPISRFRIFQLMRRYCEIACVPKEKWHPHALRHSCAVHLLSDKREGLVDVQRHLGHSDIKSTMIYLGSLTDEFNEARIRRLRDWK